MNGAEPQEEESASAAFQMAEQSVREAVRWLELAVEIIGAVLVAVGVVVAVVQLFRLYLGKHRGSYTSVRLTLARYLALALEFQLGADILSTAIAPTWSQVAQLAAIAVIRTALNYFLSLEMDRERREKNEEADPARP